MLSIGPKLDSEKDAHFGPGGPANVVRPTVEVHRGSKLVCCALQLSSIITKFKFKAGYQFAYFLRKADPYAIVLKVRCQ